MPPESELPVASDASTHATAQVTYRAPAPELRGAITSYYLVRVTGGGMVEDQLYPEWPNFRVTLSGEWRAKFPSSDWAPVPRANVTGALERALPVRGSEGLLVGVGLMPHGWPRLVGVDASGFANCTRPLADAIGPVAGALQERLTAAATDGEDAIYAVLDETFAGLLRPAPDADLVRTAHATLQDPGVRTVSDWAEAMGLSPRQLERKSLQVFGVSPKRLLRRQRVLRTLAAMVEAPQGTWTQFLDDQYVDQAHFIREFRHHMGITPKAFLARPSSFMAEAWRRRKAALGYPVQVLQPAREGS
jgi:AraC-like DNA-binding protein